MKKFLSEFKDFITRGNVLDLAVGVIIGAAFKDIVTSLTDNIIKPVLDLFIQPSSGPGIKLKEGVYLNYSAFITAVINFIIMAFVIFMIIKMLQKAQDVSKKLRGVKEEAPAEPTTKVCPFCKSEIAIDATRCPHCTSELQ